MDQSEVESELYFPYNDSPQRVDTEMDFVDEKPDLQSMFINPNSLFLNNFLYNFAESNETIKIEPPDTCN